MTFDQRRDILESQLIELFPIDVPGELPGSKSENSCLDRVRCWDSILLGESDSWFAEEFDRLSPREMTYYLPCYLRNALLEPYYELHLLDVLNQKCSYIEVDLLSQLNEAQLSWILNYVNFQLEMISALSPTEKVVSLLTKQNLETLKRKLVRLINASQG